MQILWRQIPRRFDSHSMEGLALVWDATCGPVPAPEHQQHSWLPRWAGGKNQNPKVPNLAPTHIRSPFGVDILSPWGHQLSFVWRSWQNCPIHSIKENIGEFQKTKTNRVDRLFHSLTQISHRLFKTTPFLKTAIQAECQLPKYPYWNALWLRHNRELLMTKNTKNSGLQLTLKLQIQLIKKGRVFKVFM